MSFTPQAYFYFFRSAAGLIALGLVTSAPTLEAAALSQTFSLTANGLVTGAPTTDQATLIPEGGANGLTATPVLGQGTVTQSHSLSANGLVTGSPTTDQASLITESTADGLVLGPPVLDRSILSQAHSLIATGLVTGSPTLGQAPAQGQLIGDDLTATPTLGQGVISQGHSLTGNGLVAGSPALETAVLSQTTPEVDGLTATPILGSAALTQQHGLTATGLVSGAPVLDTAGQILGIPFVCAPDIAIEKELNDSIISPSADLRLKITLTRDAGDIDPHTSEATDYTNCTASFAIYRCGSATPIATLTLDDGISRATNEAATQVFVVLWEQASVASYAGRSNLHYRFTVTTATGEIVSGDDSKPNYSGEFSIARY